MKSICMLLMLLAIGSGTEAWQDGDRQRSVVYPRLGLTMPAFRSMGHRSPLPRQPRDETASTPAAVTSPIVQKDDYEQHHLPCSAHSDCKSGDGYCRQAVGGPRCSPCVDYRMHTCDEWRDSIDGNCEVCRVQEADPQDPAEAQLDARQEEYEEESVTEAIAAPIYGRYGELRSNPSPPTQSGAGRKDFIRYRHHDCGSRNHQCAESALTPDETKHAPTGTDVLARLKPPARGETPESSYEGRSSEPESQLQKERSPTSPQRLFSSTVSEQHWPSGEGNPPVSSTVQWALHPDPASGATVQRQVLHRVIGDKEVHDTVTFHQGRHDEGDHGRAATQRNAETITPQRKMKNIATEQELAEFEQYFGDSSFAGRQMLGWEQHMNWNQPQLHQDQDAAPHQPKLHPHLTQGIQRDILNNQENIGGLLRLLNLAYHNPVPSGALGCL